jgi:hypothetical protein
LPVPPPPGQDGQDGEGLGFDDAFGLDGAFETALRDSTNDSVITQALTGSEALLSGFADSPGAAQPPSSSDAFTNADGPAGPLSPYTGQNIDVYTNAAVANISPYANPAAGGGSVDLFAASVAALDPAYSAATTPSVDTSQMLASNAPMAVDNPASGTDPGNTANSANPSLAEIQLNLGTGNQPGSQSFSTGWFTPTPIDPAPSAPPAAQGPQLLDEPALLPSASPAVDDLNSMSWEDFADKYNLATASPAPASPSFSLDAAFLDIVAGIADLFGPSALAPPAQPAYAQPPPSGSQGGWDTILGTLLADLVGFIAPLHVGQYLHPVVPPNLPPGLQAMGQMNAGMAQQALQMNSAAVRGAVVGAGAPFAAAELALATPAGGGLAFEGSVRTAARFPTATSVVTGLGDALSGNALPRAAAGAAAAATLRSAAEESENLAPQITSELSALAEEVGASLPSIGPPLAQTPAAQNLAQNFTRGIAFQNAVTGFLGSNVRNTTAMVGQTISGALRVVVPDIYRGGLAPIGDVKDVLRLTFTSQLQAMADLAKMTGTSFNIIVSPRTISISGPLADAVRSSGGFIFRFDPATNLSEVWDATGNVWVRFF